MRSWSCIPMDSNRRWDLPSYSGLLARHPAVIGGALLRDFRRQRDDASVVVVKAGLNLMSEPISPYRLAHRTRCGAGAAARARTGGPAGLR